MQIDSMRWHSFGPLPKSGLAPLSTWQHSPPLWMRKLPLPCHHLLRTNQTILPWRGVCSSLLLMPAVQFWRPLRAVQPPWRGLREQAFWPGGRRHHRKYRWSICRRGWRGLARWSGLRSSFGCHSWWLYVETTSCVVCFQKKRDVGEK